MCTQHAQLVTEGRDQSEWVRNVVQATVSRIRIKQGKRIGFAHGHGRVVERKLAGGRLWAKV